MPSPVSVTAPFAAFERSVARFAEAGLPTSVARSSFDRSSGTTAGELLRAFGSLGLTDDRGRPTEGLRQLTDAWRAGGWAEAVGALLRDHYGDGLGTLDLPAATAAAATEAMGRLAPGTGDDVVRHLLFVVGAAVAAKMPVSPDLLRRARLRVASEPSSSPGPRPAKVPPSSPDPTATRPTTVRASEARRRSWDASEALHVLIDRVYDPDSMPAGSEAERAFLLLLAALKKLSRT